MSGSSSEPGGRRYVPVFPRPGLDAASAVMGLLVGAWLVVAWFGGPGAAEVWPWYRHLGLAWDEGVAGGRVWQLLSHAVLHDGWAHLLMNVALIYFIGGRIQHFLGGRLWLAIFVGGSVLGALVHLALPPLWLPEPRLVGASGGAMALLLAYTTLAPEARMWPLPLRAGNLGLGVMLGALVMGMAQAAFSLGYGAGLRAWLGDLGLDELLRAGHGYHFGGGIAGWLCARWVLRCPPDLAALRHRRARREGG